jgi:hypothetical protein
MGAMPMLVVAATIESQVTPALGLSDGAKYGVAAVTGLLALAWWCLAGREKAKPAPAP